MDTPHRARGACVLSDTSHCCLYSYVLYYTAPTFPPTPCGQLPPSESQEDMDKDGLNYSIDTRVVEIGSGLRVLQVQLLYSEAGQGNISPTPGWSSTASSLQVHPGGKEIKLDVRTPPRNVYNVYNV